VPELRVAVHLASLRQPIKRALETAAWLGADGVEIDASSDWLSVDSSQTAIRHVRKLLDDLHMRVAAVRFVTRRGFGVLEDLDRRMASAQQAMKLAHALGCGIMVSHVGRVPEDTESAEWQRMADALSGLGHFGQHVGALLAARAGTEPAASLARLVDAVPAGLVGVAMCPGSFVRNDRSAAEAVAVLGSRIWYLYANDGVRDLARGQGIETQLGRGSADFPAVLGALEEFGYRGWFTLERLDAADPVADMRAGVSYLGSL